MRKAISIDASEIENYVSKEAEERRHNN